MSRDTKQLKTSISVSARVQVLAFCVSLIDTIWSGEREMLLRGIAAYYGYKIEKL